jgi:hypothetical protein
MIDSGTLDWNEHAWAFLRPAPFRVFGTLERFSWEPRAGQFEMAWQDDGTGSTSARPGLDRAAGFRCVMDGREQDGSAWHDPERGRWSCPPQSRSPVPSPGGDHGHAARYDHPGRARPTPPDRPSFPSERRGPPQVCWRRSRKMGHWITWRGGRSWSILLLVLAAAVWPAARTALPEPSGHGDLEVGDARREGRRTPRWRSSSSPTSSVPTAGGRPVIRDLLAEFPEDLQVAFRHSPGLAVDASERPSGGPGGRVRPPPGRFWEMAGPADGLGPGRRDPAAPCPETRPRPGRVGRCRRSEEARSRVQADLDLAGGSAWTSRRPSSSTAP